MHIQPALSALLKLAVYEAQGVLGWPAGEHQTDRAPPLDHHSSPIMSN